MESSIESTLEKIKMLEHDKEAKLKEKRTYEAMVISLSRGARDALTQATKLKHDLREATGRVETLRSRLQLENLRRNSLTDLLENTRNELHIYQEKAKTGVSDVWHQRSLLCESVHNVSDQCDVWALFTKPTSIQLALTRKVVHEHIECANGYAGRLEKATERHTAMQAERDRLQSEPDTGEEFLRIKNALRFSEAMAANLT